MKSLTISTFFLLTSLLMSAQEPLFLTKEQNSEWIEHVREQKLEGKLSAIKQRLMADTEVKYQVSGIPHQNRSLDGETKSATNCRPLYIFRNPGENAFPLEPNPDKETVREINSALTTENISEVIIETELKETALYGIRGSCGVITLDVVETEVYRKLKKILRL